MKRIAAGIIVTILFALTMSPTYADGALAIGKMRALGKNLNLKLKQNIVVLKGNASLVNTATGSKMLPNSMRLDAMNSDTLKIDLANQKNGSLALRSAVATGGVIVKGKRANLTTGSDGQKQVIIQDVLATAQNAEMPEGEDKIILTGNVVLKILDPGVAEPSTVVTGAKVVVLLTDAEISVDAPSDGLVEITMTMKEKEQSQTRRK